MGAKVEPQAGKVNSLRRAAIIALSHIESEALSACVIAGEREGTRACAGRVRWAAMLRPRNRRIMHFKVIKSGPSCLSYPSPTFTIKPPGARQRRASRSCHALAHL